MQLREGNRQTRLNTALEVSAARDRAFDPVYMGSDAETWIKGLQGSAELFEGEQIVFDLLMSRQWHNLQNVIYAAENDAINNDLLENWVLPAYRQTFSSPGGEKWFAKNKAVLPASTIKYLKLTVG